MDETFDNLPDVLQRIAMCAGLGAAMALAKAYGGIRINIPKKVEDSELAKIVGLDAAEKIVKALGHGQCLVPMGAARGEAARREVARRVLRNGGTSVEAALAADISERTAWRVRAGMKESGPETLPLFSDEPKKSA